MMEWFRSIHGAPTHRKWLAVSRKSGQPVAVVVAVVWALMDHASRQADRGSVVGFEVEDHAAYLGVDDGDVEAVLSTLSDRGWIEDGRIASWGEHQTKREDGSAERAKAWRERKKAQETDRERDRTQSNATEPPDTDTDTDTDSESKNSVSNETDAAGPRDPTEWVLREGVAALTAAGVPERQARSAIGKWRKTEKDADIRRHIEAMQANQVLDPVPWITARIGAIERQRDGPKQRWAI